MALAQTRVDLNALLDSELYNPGKRFLTNADYDAQVKKATILWAQKVKGLWLQVSLTSVASQAIYTLDSAHQRIREAWYIRNLDLATEERTRLDVITMEDRAFIDNISAPQADVSNMALTLAGSTADKPKYILHQRESGRVILMDTPAVSGDIILLKTISGPTTAFATGTTWEADAMDLPGIAAKVCQGLRMKSRDTQEALAFKADFEECVNAALLFRAKTRQRKQMGDGQSMITRLRPIYGAK